MTTRTITGHKGADRDMSAATTSTFQRGDAVRVGRNDAGVTPGARGRFLHIVEETGNLLVDVEGRGRVALTRDSVTAANGAVTPAAKREFSRELYLIGADAAKELGCTYAVLMTLAAATGVGSRRGKRLTTYTAADLRRLRAARAACAEFGVTPKVAVRILRKLGAAG